MLRCGDVYKRRSERSTHRLFPTHNIQLTPQRGAAFRAQCGDREAGYFELESGAVDGARTRDPRRDRPVL